MRPLEPSFNISGPREPGTVRELRCLAVGRGRCEAVESVDRLLRERTELRNDAGDDADGTGHHVPDPVELSLCGLLRGDDCLHAVDDLLHRSLRHQSAVLALLVHLLGGDGGGRRARSATAPAMMSPMDCAAPASIPPQIRAIPRTPG